MPLLITSFCPILIWIILMCFFLAICFAVQDGISRLQRLHQIPCSRCAFFTQNYHLKCTVHPCKALSEQAIDCLDYEPAVVSPAGQGVGRSPHPCPSLKRRWLKETRA